MALRSTFVAVALASTALSQFVPAPPPDAFINQTGYANVPVRYKEVETGICETRPNVKSFSGYADVAKDEHIFFWFFEARDVDPDQAPLTVWLSGGPGASSMLGLFQELGPCRIDSSGTVLDNPYSWSTVSNMLFIDQPVETGFSYTIPQPGFYNSTARSWAPLPNGTVTCQDSVDHACGTYSNPSPSLTNNSTQSAAPNFWKALQGFMGVFPQYSSSGGFHFATESYGGHYGPVFSAYIEQQNANLPPDAHRIDLKSVSIGNGWYDALIQYPAYYNYSTYPGNPYDLNLYNNNATLQSAVYEALYESGGCVEQSIHCAKTNDDDICSAADDFCIQYVSSVIDRDPYDIRELAGLDLLTGDPFPPGYYLEYLNREDVLRAIGAYVNLTDKAELGQVSNGFSATGDDEKESMTIEDCRALASHGVYVVQYAGDADYDCNWLGGQVVASTIDAPGYSGAGFANISTSDGIVHGVVKQADNFAFSRIYQSGHEVPFYQPLVALTLFNRTIHGLDIETGQERTTKGSGYRTLGPKYSLYREGNGTVQYELLPQNATYNTTTNEPNPYK